MLSGGILSEWIGAGGVGKVPVRWDVKPTLRESRHVLYNV